MRKHMIFFLLLTLFLGLSIMGCKALQGEKTGKVNLYIKDTPIDLSKVDHIYITVSEVSAHKVGNGFVPILQEETTIDLKKVMDTKELLASVNLEAGKYTELRLTITKGEIVIEGVTYSMDIPSMEVKIPCVFEVEEDGTVNITLDFDARNSILVIEAGNSGKYILRPVIIVESISYE